MSENQFYDSPDQEEPVQPLEQFERSTGNDRYAGGPEGRPIQNEDEKPPREDSETPDGLPESIFDDPRYHLVALNKPLPPTPGNHQDFQITWLGDNDPEMPLNWSGKKKAYSFFIVSLASLVTVFGSAVIGPGTPEIQKEWHLGLPVVTLNVSLYVVGFALGPVLWGPMSEAMGRIIPMFVGIFGMMLFAYACATAENFQTLVLSRFFAGTFGAASISVGPAMLSDLFATVQRGKAIGVVSLMIFAGPMLAPVIGGYVSASYLGWRWTQYLWAFVTSLSCFLLLFLPETYAPKLLVKRARDIRNKTGNWAVTAPLENQEIDFKDVAKRVVLKPLRMLVVEPVLLLISIYHGFIYGILYLCLEAVPLIFSSYGWKGGNVYLPYLGMLIGSFAMSFLTLFFFEPRFQKKLAASGKLVVPDERLPPMMFAAVVFPIGIFLLCWSGKYHVFWFVPVLGCAFVGAGLIGIFMAAFNYIIDTYLMLAASAIAANTFLRSGFGAAFPLFAHPLFVNLGFQWAGTLLGCLALLLMPVPFLFYIYGAKIRALSKFAANTDEMGELDEIEEMETHLTRRSTNPSMVQM